MYAARTTVLKRKPHYKPLCNYTINIYTVFLSPIAFMPLFHRIIDFINAIYTALHPSIMQTAHRISFKFSFLLQTNNTKYLYTNFNLTTLFFTLYAPSDYTYI